MRMNTCAGCDRPIYEKYLLRVLDKFWHSECVNCFTCKIKLREKCYSRDGKLFCKNDFFRNYGTKCSGCYQGILPTELVRKARNKSFHLKCFTCFICRKQLTTGDELYIIDNNKFICKADFNRYHHNNHNTFGPETELEDQESSASGQHLMMGSGVGDEDVECDDEDFMSGQSANGGQLLSHNSQSSPAMSAGSSSLGADSLDHNPSSPMSSLGINTSSDRNMGIGSSGPASGGNGSGSGGEGTGATHLNDDNTPGGTKRRGPRTTIKAKQLETLKNAFNSTPKPTRHIREELAKETGLNMRVIQVWFQNRRSKERRMKQLNSMAGRHRFFARSPRRSMRPLRPEIMGDHSSDSLVTPGDGPNNGFGGYFSEWYPHTSSNHPYTTLDHPDALAPGGGGPPRGSMGPGGPVLMSPNGPNENGPPDVGEGTLTYLGGDPHPHGSPAGMINLNQDPHAPHPHPSPVGHSHHQPPHGPPPPHPNSHHPLTQIGSHAGNGPPQAPWGQMGPGVHM